MITHYQVPVRIGKVTVRPGDIIMGDIDGVICIPREIAYNVLLRAEGIERNEVEIFSWGHQGDTISEIIDKGVSPKRYCESRGQLRKGRRFLSNYAEAEGERRRLRPAGDAECGVDEL